jgi:hypothetical protein
VKKREGPIECRFGVTVTLARSSIRDPGMRCSWRRASRSMLAVWISCRDARRGATASARPSSQVTCGLTELSLDDLDPELTQLARVRAA